MLVLFTENYEFFIFTHIVLPTKQFSIISCRQEQLREREKQKEAEVEALKRSMQSGMVSFPFPF